MPFLIGLLKTALQLAIPYVIQDYFEKKRQEREEAKKKALEEKEKQNSKQG